MPSDAPIPAEREALDRPWRLWASVAVGAFVVVSLALGFVVLPASEEPGFDPLAAICRAIGIPGYGGPSSPSAEAPAPAAVVSEVAWTGDTRRLLASADAQRGAAIAAETCAGCHGENGIGVDPQFPNLAGQPAAAVVKQLQDYAAGDRKSDIMAGIAQALDDRQTADVAAYYAARPPIARRAAEMAVVPAVHRLAAAGDPARALPACDSCHGAARGGPVGTPVLLGQPADYLRQQLEAYAAGERRNDLFGRMRTVAGALTPEEIEGLASYYRGAPVPKYKP